MVISLKLRIFAVEVVVDVANIHTFVYISTNTHIIVYILTLIKHIRVYIHAKAFMSTEGERISEVISRFCESKADFARKIGEKPQTISNWVSRGAGKNVLNKILASFPEINANWLLTGEGNMLNNEDDTITPIIDTEEALNNALEKGVKLLPEVDFKFAAGQIELINGVESIKRYWYLPDCRDCEAVAQIAGNSMLPAYPSGCWVALKKHGFSIDTATQIPFGNVFGIVVQDKFTGDYHGHIKILRRYKDQTLCRKFWIAHSLNESEYDDFDIEIAQVRSLWIVKQHIVSDVLL